MNRNQSAISILVAVAAFFTLATQPAYTAAVSWDDGAGDNAWGTLAGGANNNWDGNVTPSTGDEVTINGAYTVDYDTALYATGGTELNSILMGYTGTQTLNISADMSIANTTAVNASFEIYMWTGSTVNHSAGTVTLGNSDGSRSLYIGNVPSGSAYNLTGSARLELKDWVYMSGGTFNLNGGSVASSPTFWQLHGGAMFNYTGGALELGSTMSAIGADSSFVFDGNGAGLQATLGPANGTAMAVTQGTLKVVGDAIIDEIVQGGSINNALSLGADSTYEVVINADSDQFLQLTTTGGYGNNIALGGGVLSVTDFSSAPVGTTWDILTLSNAGVYGDITGDFATFNLPEKFVVLDNGSLSGVYTIGVVPEPASLSLLVLGGLALCRRRRVC